MIGPVPGDDPAAEPSHAHLKDTAGDKLLPALLTRLGKSLGSVLDNLGRAAHQRLPARYEPSPTRRPRQCGYSFRAPLLAFVGPMHRGVSLATAAFFRAECCDQRGIDHSPGFEHQALADQHIGNDPQDLLSRLVLLQQVSEPQDRALIGQGLAPKQLGKLPKQRQIEQRPSPDRSA